MTAPEPARPARNRDHVIITRWGVDWPWKRRRADRGKAGGGAGTGSVLLAVASVLLAADGAAMGIVSWHAQFAFVFAAKQQVLASALEALGLDAGAVIFALLGIALARLQRRAVVERMLVVACAAGSCVMNLLGADLGSPRSVAVYVMPPVLFAAMSDRLIAVIRRSAIGKSEDQDMQRSAWRAAGLGVLYVLRFLVAAPSTASGARLALLAATPLPERPARTAVVALPRAEILAADLRPLHGAREPARRSARPDTKTARFLAAVQERYGDLAGIGLDKVGRICAELAPAADLNTGSARTVLRTAILAAQQPGEGQ
jgi:hypothetical protein